MTYAEAVDYLFTRLPMFTRIGSAAYKADLNNITVLSSRLGDPHKKFKSIHVGGTNGKGSVSHMLAAILQTSGYKTGLFTSPHLYDFRERMRINGEMISESDVIAFVERIQPIVEEIHPSFFEITVAMAFEHFAKNEVDIAVIEVGLGGRLDSTNIIQPELSVITNIGWDHMNILGNTLQEIATEKAGIIKKDVPVIFGERQPETDLVFIEAAKKAGTELHFADEEYQPQSMEWTDDKLCIDILHVHEKRIISFSLDLRGIYQAKNLCTSLAALDQLTLQGYHFPAHDVHVALSTVRERTGLQGRWDIIGKKPTVVLDVAHNQSGIGQLLEQLKHVPHKRLHLVIGMVKDKDISQVLNLFPKDALYYFTNAHIPRALPASELKRMAASMALLGDTYYQVNDALCEAKKYANADDLIVVCGSVFTVAEVSR